MDPKYLPTPWPSIVVGYLGVSAGIVTLFVPNINVQVRIFGATFILLITGVAALLCYYFWTNNQQAISWWILLLAMIIISLVLILSILNIGQ